MPLPSHSLPSHDCTPSRTLAYTVQAQFDKDPGLKAFGMRVENRQMEVAARVLPNPRLTYASPANFDPKGEGCEGGWEGGRVGRWEGVMRGWQWVAELTRQVTEP